MQLPPGLLGRLGPGPAGSPSGSPPLPVLRHPASGAAPFRFSPLAQSLPRRHPLFEVTTGTCRGTRTCRTSSRRFRRCRSAPAWRPSGATWPAASRSSPASRPTSTTTGRCTRTCAPCAGARSPPHTCWTCTSLSGTTRSSNCWPSARACTSAWWRAARTSSVAAASAKSTWCGRTATRPTSASISPGRPEGRAGWPRGRRPWRCAPGRPRSRRCRRPQSCEPTATGSLPPSALAKGPLEDLKTPRREVTSDPR